MTIWHGLTTLAHHMYVNMCVCMFIRMYVRRIKLMTIQIVRKLNVDAFTCKKLHSRLEMGDLAGGGGGVKSTPCILIGWNWTCVQIGLSHHFRKFLFKSFCFKKNFYQNYDGNFVIFNPICMQGR